MWRLVALSFQNAGSASEDFDRQQPTTIMEPLRLSELYENAQHLSPCADGRSTVLREIGSTAYRRRRCTLQGSSTEIGDLWLDQLLILAEPGSMTVQVSVATLSLCSAEIVVAAPFSECRAMSKGSSIRRRLLGTPSSMCRSSSRGVVVPVTGRSLPPTLLCLSGSTAVARPLARSARWAGTLHLVDHVPTGEISCSRACSLRYSYGITRCEAWTPAAGD